MKKPSFLRLLYRFAFGLGFLTSITLGPLALIGTQAAHSTAEANMLLAFMGAPILGYVIGVFVHRGVGGLIMIASVIVFTGITVLDGHRVTGILYWIVPFLTTGVLFSYTDYKEKHMETAP